jgi:Superinfection immunity protein
MLELWFACVALYFAPTFVAAVRKKKRGMSIFILNLLTGWTVIGWLIALYWAVKTDLVDIPIARVSGNPVAGVSKLCIHCGKYSPSEAKFCANCGQAFTPGEVPQESF